MNSLLAVPLVLVIISSVFVTVVALDMTELRNSGWDDFDVGDDDYGSSYFENGSQDSLSLSVTSSTISFDWANISLSLLIVSLGVVAGASITIVASGIDTMGIRAIGAIVFWLGLFGVFSIAGVIGFLSFPLLGLPLYFMLTLCFSMGVYKEVNG